MSDMIITKHFMERFFERVLDKECTYCRYDVLNIIQEMMHHYESKAFNTFKSSTEKVIEFNAVLYSYIELLLVPL